MDSGGFLSILMPNLSMVVVIFSDDALIELLLELFDRAEKEKGDVPLIWDLREV